MRKNVGKEIERKFLVCGSGYTIYTNRVRIRQGYLSLDPQRTVRIRVVETAAWLNIKGITVGATRNEFEYAIPLFEAEQLLTLCIQPIIEKTRIIIPRGDDRWEVDVFAGDNSGLVIAEIELKSEDQQFNAPEWIGKEVTTDPRFYNVNLVKNPFKNFNQEEFILQNLNK